MFHGMNNKNVFLLLRNELLMCLTYILKEIIVIFFKDYLIRPSIIPQLTSRRNNLNSYVFSTDIKECVVVSWISTRDEKSKSQIQIPIEFVTFLPNAIALMTKYFQLRANV